MRKLLLASALLLGLSSAANATCTSPAVMHDFPGTSFNMSLTTAPDGNCGSNVSLPNSTATGSITTTQSVTLTPTGGQSAVGIQVTGTWTGTLFVEGSIDGTNFIQTTVVPVLSGSVQSATITASGMYQANLAGFASFRIRGNSVASGTAVVTLIGTTGTATVMADNPFPVTGYTGMTALNMVGNTAIGSATTDKPLMLGGSSTGASGGNAQVAKVDTSGNLYTLPGTIATWGLVGIGGGTNPTNAIVAGCTYNATPPTLSTGQAAGLQCNSNGELIVGNTNTNITNGDGVSTTTWSVGSPVASLGYAFNGTSYDRLEDDTNKNLKTTGPMNVTPNDCSGSVTTGGTAQNALAATATVHGLTIMNIDTTEPLWISFTTTAAASTAGSFPLQAAAATTFATPGSFTTPNGFGTNHALSVIAATTGHKWSCTYW